MKFKDFWKSKTFVSLDIETTGLDPQRHEIIEIGAVRFREGIEIDRFNVLIKPTTEVPTFIKQLTGIRESDLEEGLSIKQALVDLLEFVQKDFLVCHNSSFDIGFIQNQLTMHLLPSLSNAVYDTLDLSRIYFPFLNNHKLATLARALQIEDSKQYHRALNDALITGNIFFRMTEFVLGQVTFEINNSLLELAEYAEERSDLEQYLRQIVSYQRRFALIDSKKDDYQRLYESPLASSLGFFRSHNLIRTENWFQNNGLDVTEDNEEQLFTSTQEPRSEIEASMEGPDKEDSIVNMSFGSNGFLATKFPEYEFRAGQVEMASSIDKVLRNDSFLIVEAGTGIGKTLAYLIPALHFAYRNGKKVFVSTNTKNLQEQLFFKDLSVIKECIPIPFQAVILKGRENYLCYRKWNDIRQNIPKHLTQNEAAIFLNLLVWQKYSRSGDISENSSFYRESDTDSRRHYSSLWRKLSSERYFCSGRKCPDHSRCYYMTIRQKAERSSLVVTNHSLLLTDLNYDRFSEEDNNYLIVDEAHNLPEMASSYLGISISYTDLNSFFQQLAHINIRRKLQTGILPALKADIQKSVIDNSKKNMMQHDIDHIIFALDEKKQSISDFFRLIAERVKNTGSFGKLRIKKYDQDLSTGIDEQISFLTILQSKLFSLSQHLQQLSKQQINDYDVHQDKLTGALEKIKDLIEALKVLREPDLDNFALWLSSFASVEPNVPSGVINYAPLEVAGYLKKILYSRMNSLVFTSATLALRGSFKYFTLRMGLDLEEEKDISELIIHSPFNFDKQTLVLAAGYLPVPSDEYFIPQSIELLKTTIYSAGVGSMVLFTSYRDLNRVYDQISEEFYKKEILLLAQGRGQSRTVTLNEFKADGRAVLLGTSSFWEGVDVPGESLSLLILYKLPFQVPTEPIVEAYYEKLRREGKDPFMHSTLPNAMLRFRQGFGRLIRNKKDRGIILIADSRVINKYYGAYFREIIPTKIYNATTLVEISDLVSSWFRA